VYTTAIYIHTIRFAVLQVQTSLNVYPNSFYVYKSGINCQPCMIVQVSSMKCWLITPIFKSVITSQHHLEKGPRRSLKL